jgi:hypothetical protein
MQEQTRSREAGGAHRAPEAEVIRGRLESEGALATCGKSRWEQEKGSSR